MDIIKMHDRALETTTAIVANIAPRQLGLPTPCAQFDVKALLDHMIEGNHLFVTIAPGRKTPSYPRRVTRGRRAADAVSRVGPWRGSVDNLETRHQRVRRMRATKNASLSSRASSRACCRALTERSLRARRQTRELPASVPRQEATTP